MCTFAIRSQDSAYNRTDRLDSLYTEHSKAPSAQYPNTLGKLYRRRHCSAEGFGTSGQSVGYYYEQARGVMWHILRSVLPPIIL